MIIKIKIVFLNFFLVILLFSYDPVYAVTYQEVQDDPINLSINLKYAQEQRSLGNTRAIALVISQ